MYNLHLSAKINIINMLYVMNVLLLLNDLLDYKWKEGAIKCDQDGTLKR